MTSCSHLKIDKLFLILVFGLVIYIPFFVWVVLPYQAVSTIEKRTLALPPGLPNSMATIKQYPKSFNRYYSDHFGLREYLTRSYFRLVYSLGMKNSVGEVTFGKDDWLFLGNIEPGEKDYGDPMADATHVSQFSVEQLEGFAQSIRAIQSWIEGQGVKYIFVIAPSKYSIYFDKMPDYIIKQNKESATDQLVSYLRKHTDVNVVDLREALLEEKKKHIVYLKTDTHWNYYGANAAQFEMMTQVATFFPNQVVPFYLEDNQFEVSIKDGGDLAGLIKTGRITEELAEPIFDGFCQAEYSETLIDETKIGETRCESESLKALVFGDSFFSTLQPFISRYFNKTTYVRAQMNYKHLKEYIELESPDIVIEELVERNFPYVPDVSALPTSAD
ncbi:MAG: hypothetical protein KAG19_02515 [Methylococcales bacterium]|nr:hypothetical protein [Methylococcales bacterium]